MAKFLWKLSSSLTASGALTLGYRHNVKAELCGKRLVIVSKLDEGTRLNTAVVKNICSTDKIQAEKKFKAPFSFTPSHSLVLYTNHLPKIATTDEGTWRRFILVPFNAQISEARDIKNYSDYLYENAGGAILSWIIEGAERIITKNGKPDSPEIVSSVISKYRADNDCFASFLRECCVVASDASEQSSTVYSAYRKYCNIIGERVHSTTEFYKALSTNAPFSNRESHVTRLLLQTLSIQVMQVIYIKITLFVSLLFIGFDLLKLLTASSVLVRSARVCVSCHEGGGTYSATQRTSRIMPYRMDARTSSMSRPIESNSTGNFTLQHNLLYYTHSESAALRSSSS